MKSRILIVDDNTEIHTDFRKILVDKSESTELSRLTASMFGETQTKTEAGFDLEFANQGEAAVDMVRRAAQEKRPYDMAFVDVRMPPGMDGVQTIAELRKIDPAMGFVICTAYSDYTPEEAGQKVGLSNGLMFIVKPFDAGIVRQLAQRLCGRVTTAKAG